MTTTETLPQATRDAGFYLPKDIPGGPVFAFGGNVGKVDFSKITPTTARNLMLHGYDCIAHRDEASGSEAAELGAGGEDTESNGRPTRPAKK